jgi:hypothetical protein
MPIMIWSLIRDYLYRRSMTEDNRLPQPLDPVVHNLQDVLWRKEGRPSYSFFPTRPPGSVH